MRAPVTIAVEGVTDAAVLRRLLDEVGLVTGDEYLKEGKHALDESLRAYDAAARFSCWLILRDLDRDAACAPILRADLLPTPAPHMRLHLAVRAVESWLLADAAHLARALGVPAARLPRDPEAIVSPKRKLVDIARHSSRRAIREALVPAAGTTAAVGPGYTAFLVDFAATSWRPELAAKRSESLARLRRFLTRASQAAGSQSSPWRCR